MRTGSLLDRFFGAFEGTRSAYPIAIFRIAFFVGLAVHFFPSMLHLHDNYSAGALRNEEWNHWLYTHLEHMPEGFVGLLALVTMAACLLAMVGFATRAAVIASGIGFYTFASFNGLPVQTLAIVNAWAILLAWMICGGGDEALSVDAFLKRRREPRAADEAAPRAPKLLSGLVFYQAMMATFFAGIEKVIAGWPWTNEMGILLNYPRGFVIRDWVASATWLHGTLVTRGFSWLTLFVEIGGTLVLVLGRPRARALALLVYEAFFIGIVSMLEVPPLFYFIFAFGGLFALDDAQVDAVVSRLRRLRPSG